MTEPQFSRKYAARMNVTDGAVPRSVCSAR
jgi:hypothetical protein